MPLEKVIANYLMSYCSPQHALRKIIMYTFYNHFTSIVRFYVRLIEMYGQILDILLNVSLMQTIIGDNYSR